MWHCYVASSMEESRYWFVFMFYHNNLLKISEFLRISEYSYNYFVDIVKHKKIYKVSFYPNLVSSNLVSIFVSDFVRIG